jgi:hypothetical protein
MTPRRVVDTNVAVIANGDGDVPAECELKCVRFLRDLVSQGGLVMDSADRIFTEYRRNLNMAGQPGVGDQFMRWVATNRFNPAVCDQVQLTQVGEDATEFAEFPTDPALNTLDPSDRKFVAVSCGHAARPPVYVAADRGWARHQGGLAACGVTITHLCPVPGTASED